MGKFLDEYGNPTPELGKTLIKWGVVLFAGLILFSSTVKFVPAGTVRVVTQFGRVTGRVLQPGISAIIPLAEGTTAYNTRQVTYETAVEEKQKGSQADYKDYPVDTNTKDGQPVDIAYTIRFSVDPMKAAWIAQNIGSEGDLVEKIIKTESRIWARNVPRRYEAEILYTGEGSEKVQQDIEDQLRGVFEANGILLDRVGIREIYFDEAYVNAIKQKQVEAVNVETAKNIALKAEEEKKARITKAEGEAREQELQRATISDELLRKMWIEKWNGVLPSYVAGDAGNLIQIPTE